MKRLVLSFAGAVVVSAVLFGFGWLFMRWPEEVILGAVGVVVFGVIWLRVWDLMDADA